MKNNKICGKLRKGGNFAATNLPLLPQKTTVTDQYIHCHLQIEHFNTINTMPCTCSSKCDSTIDHRDPSCFLS